MAGLPAWTNNEDFRSALCFAPCGCEQILNARKIASDEDRAAAEEAGRFNQARWHCPFAGHPEPGHPRARPLDDPAALDALECAERVTSLPVKRCRTCPGWYASQPFAAEVCRARVASERGLLAERYGGAPANVIVLAVDLLDAATGERTANDIERMKRKAAAPPPRRDD